MKNPLNLYNISGTNLINIFGRRGSGRTTFTIDLLKESLLSKDFINYCVWFQAGDRISKKKVYNLTSQNSLIFSRFDKRVLFSPYLPSYDLQDKFIKSILSKRRLLPPETKFIVIDNISTNLRAVINSLEKESKFTLLNSYFENQLSPFYFFCLSCKIKLILIHNVSKDIKNNKIKKYQDGIYSRFNSFDIFLEKIERQKGKSVVYINNKKEYFLKIDKKGIDYYKI